MNFLKVVKKDDGIYIEQTGTSASFPSFGGEPTFLIDEAMRQVGTQKRDGWRTSLYAYEAAAYLSTINTRPDGQSVVEACRRWAVNWATQKIAMDGRVPIDPKNLSVDSDQFGRDVEEYISEHFQGAA